MTVRNLQIGELICRADVLDRAMINQTHAVRRGLELLAELAMRKIASDRFDFTLSIASNFAMLSNRWL